jgi:hypothetical protein
VLTQFDAPMEPLTGGAEAVACDGSGFGIPAGQWLTM